MNKKLAAVTSASQKILKEYDLCDYCLGRLYAKKLKLKSNQRLGKKLRKSLKTKGTKCYICKNVFESLPYYVEKMADVSGDYEFKTFLVGAKLKPSILDRDDHIRSQYRLKGIDAVKTNVTRELSRLFSQKTKKKIQPSDPDVVFMADFKQESCSVHSKPISFFGRYTKEVRDIPQKQKPCSNCQGKGCVTCGHHGMTEFDSVEGMISKFLFEKFGAVQAKITWIGGEDVTSTVSGSGRPFFVKLFNPKKRTPHLQKKIKLEKITLHGLKKIDRIPIGPIPFVSKTALLVVCERPISGELLLRLDELQKSNIAVYETSGKRAEKKVQDVKYEMISGNSFVLHMTAEGGLPLKRLVSGENVFPNISDLLETKCRCEKFDFKDVQIANQHFLHLV
ncbi:tRNA pseudouridine(54/55) synthase Pus10 [Candidatus Nitrosotenuis cloacae]|uniref:tRNA pseudouridine(54/55) synthase Pus10 n=1 Tax=Candidatus Nitrosotenuis cloacae TaxID=1603555 RepID=UPI002282AA2D|nr:tRNA pseudouridine(54/55) synthase Pus10 [Candidatus Nitrosotenuis cloacae]